MYKKILSYIIVAIFFVSMLTFSVFADSVTVNVSYDMEANVVTIFGNAEKNVVITIAHEELLPDVMSEENCPSVIKAVTAISGRFSCEIGLPSTMQVGKQIVYATTLNSEATASFIYADKDAADSVIQSINDAHTFEERVTILNENITVVGIDPEDAVYFENKDVFAKILLERDYADSTEFLEAYNTLYPLVVLNGAQSSAVPEILENHSDFLGINYNNDIVYDERLTDEIKDRLYLLISSEDFIENYSSDDFSFAERLEELKALSALQLSENWLTVKNIITKKFTDVFASMIDNNAYALIKDKDKVFSRMMKYNFTSFDAVEKAFKVAVTATYKAENPVINEVQSNSQSSMGGVGGGSLGTQYTTPPEVEEYVEPETYSDIFSDVPKSHWANQSVNILYEKKVISGYPDGTFQPSKLITRAEFTKLASAFANGLEKVSSENFSDVNESDWFYSCISDASAYGIISGTGEGKFSPHTNIKREDAALIVFRILEAQGKAPIGSKVFSDRSDISDYARSAISALGSAGIVSGTGNGSFMPKNFITRAEAAQLLYNAFVK